jgi:fructose-1,6-bisphosphatase-3
MQFKAEGKMIERRPDWNLDHRRLLHRIDLKKGTVMLGNKEYELLDKHLPTINPEDPYAYSPEEQECLNRIKTSFVNSRKLRDHMEWIVRHGGMWAKYDGLDSDADWLWYMWGGPKSPLFGKDKMATFETYFIGDKDTHKENKNPYFDLIHDAAFVKRIGREFGCGEDVLIVNGHVPVKIEKGEQPVKRGGNAVTIDGAFSEAYGDRGYTLVLKPDRIELAEHSPFSSVDAVIDSGADIVPKITTIRQYDHPRTVKETDEGHEIQRRIDDLESLVKAYQEGVVREKD